MKNKIIVALDVDSPKEASKLFETLAPFVGGFKVGPRLTFRCDKSFLKDLSQAGVLFFDHKFFDIPTTTTAAVEVAAEMGAHWVTVHALNGPACLKKLAEAEVKIKKEIPQFRVLAVTVLTSFSEQTLPPIWKSQPLSESVLSLAESAQACGINSLVCSPHEIEKIKQANPSSFLVVPGIRPEGANLDDQSRVASPSQALASGADALVVGRPITASRDPLLAVRQMTANL